jgi:hypothetical protein
MGNDKGNIFETHWWNVVDLSGENQMPGSGNFGKCLEDEDFPIG